MVKVCGEFILATWPQTTPHSKHEVVKLQVNLGSNA